MRKDERADHVKKSLPAEETALFCEQVSMLLHAGIALHDGMDALVKTYQGTRYGKWFTQLEECVRDTGSLCQALEDAGIFPKYMVSMTSIGEQAGMLEDTMDALAQYYRREAQVRRAIRSAVVYPLALICMMAVVIAVLAINVMPIFRQVYGAMGAEMSAASSAVMRFGTTAGQVVLGLVALALVCAVVVALLVRTRYRQKVIAFFSRAVPAVRTVNEKLSAARFAQVLSRLLASGFPMEEAIALVPSVLPDEAVRRKVAACQAHIADGMGVAEAITETGIFSDMHNRMIHVGFLAGQVDSVMRRLADSYEEEADDEIRRLVSVIEPGMVAVLSVVIGAILLSVMLPLASILSTIA